MKYWVKCIGVIGLVGLVWTCIILWTQRNINYFLDYFGKEKEVGLFLSALLSLVLNGIIFGLNVVAEIVKLFL